MMGVIPAASSKERIILLNEGTWQADNGRVSYFEDGEIVSNQWFRDVNGMKLGDTPSDIIEVKPGIIAIAVNWSNIIQFIDSSARRLAEIEDIPNNRKLASDGEYLYVTSYAHECMTANGLKTFTKGFVAKIDIDEFRVIDAVEVGYEPEGIAFYKGKLFVANSGGYAFQEGHEYEKTISVIDVADFIVEGEIDTEQINLYGKISQSGQYLCINSPGDYYSLPAATIILDCEAYLEGMLDSDCFRKLDFASTYSTTDTEGNFYTVGSSYSYIDGDYKFDYLTLDPGKIMSSDGKDGIYGQMPGSLISDLQDMQMPYSLYVNPYSGYIYATDAGGFVEGGTMYQWSPEGELLGKHQVYINPAHFLALKDDEGSGMEETLMRNELQDGPIYNLQGMRISAPQAGEIYIRNGKKYIHKP